MQRREFVRAVITASLAPKLLLSQEASSAAPTLPAPVPWTQGLNPHTPLPVTEVAPEIAEVEVRFFTAQQMAALSRLSALLLPPLNGKPGALEAQTPRFLDFLIGSSPEPRKKLYTAGLDWLNSESQKRYSKSFSALDDEAAGTLLKPWLRTWMTDHPPTEAHADFVNAAHNDIRNATINSKAWSDAPSEGAEDRTAVGLYWSPIEPDLHAPAAQEYSELPAHVRAVPKPGESVPVYRR